MESAGLDNRPWTSRFDIFSSFVTGECIGDKNIADFVAHLTGYGFQTSVPELMQDETGKSLRNLDPF